MNAGRKLAIVVVSSVLVLAAASAFRVSVVQESQQRVASGTLEMLDPRAMTDPSHAPPGDTTAGDQVDDAPGGSFERGITGLARERVNLGAYRIFTEALLWMLIVLCCGVTAYISGLIWPSVIVGVAGWIGSAVSQAMIVMNGFAQAGVTQKIFAERVAPGVGTSAPVMEMRFASAVVLGFASTLLVGAALPAFFGTAVGLVAKRTVRTVREVREDVRELRGDPLDGPPGTASSTPAAASGRVVCECGTANIATAVECYACGKTLRVSASSAGDDSSRPQGPPRTASGSYYE